MNEASTSIYEDSWEWLVRKVATPQMANEALRNFKPQLKIRKTIIALSW